jgi:hypothetical protein
VREEALVALGLTVETFIKKPVIVVFSSIVRRRLVVAVGGHSIRVDEAVGKKHLRRIISILAGVRARNTPHNGVRLELWKPQVGMRSNCGGRRGPSLAIEMEWKYKATKAYPFIALDTIVEAAVAALSGKHAEAAASAWGKVLEKMSKPERKKLFAVVANLV